MDKDELIKKCNEVITYFFELLEAGQRVYLRISATGNASIAVHDIDDLSKFKKLSGIKETIVKENLGNSQYARVTHRNIKMDIYPKGAVFKGCRLVPREITVPAQPEHTETVYVVECGEEVSKLKS